MEKRKGLVLKKQNRSCIVITPEGEFCKIPLPKNTVLVGEEVFFTNSVRFSSFKKYFLVVASIILLLLAVPVYKELTPAAAAAAYVSLDINPSVEFAVDTGQKITEVHGLNSAGQELLKSVMPVHLDIYKGIEMVVAEAVKKHYLDGSKENIILSAITSSPAAKPVVIESNVYEAINKSLQSTSIQSEVLVGTVDKDTGLKAQKAGVSSGKYLLYVQAQKKGVSISIPELKQSNIVQLQKEKNIKIRQLVPQHAIKHGKSENSNGQQDTEDKPGKAEAVQLQNKPNKPEPDKAAHDLPKSNTNSSAGTQQIKGEDIPDKPDDKPNKEHSEEKKIKNKKNPEKAERK